MVGSRVYIGGLPYGTNERDLERFFRGYGRMRDVLIKSGYGFVEFDDYHDAEDAVYELNGKKLLGERVTVERARGTPRGRDQWTGTSRSSTDYRSTNSNSTSYDRYGPPTRTNYRVIVENLSSRVSWQDLKDHMRQAGEVTYADAHKQNRNEGVVEFVNHSDMKNAIEKFDGSELNGRRIKVIEDKSNNRRKHSASRSRSRSRSRSASARSYSKSRSRSRSKSGNRKSKSRSHSKRKSPKKSKSRSVSKSRSRSRHASKERSRSRSRSAYNSKNENRSRSHSPDH